ncbi:DUF7279 family protein [Providencia rustigianii]|uniref:DUF7279 family protein n=1 Tax=Providencia rustigianii TaxID=158850 RepID=UPI00223EBB17|nr:hypothetical protein [Providencia rustigianii]
MRVDTHVFYACSAETIDASVDFVLTISDAFSYIEKSKYFPVKPTKKQIRKFKKHVISLIEQHDDEESW